MLGLDSLEPSLAFDELAADMPVLTSLREGGLWAPMRTTIPAITCPAWASMMTGRDPGALGIYGFRGRADTSYSALATVTSASVRHPAVWDVCSEHGRRVTAVAVPPAHPPVPVNGEWVSCFLTPAGGSYTYPPALRDEVERVAPGYAFDVEGFRGAERERILADAYDMAEARWALVEHLMESRRSDLVVACEIGPDRVQHQFWSDHDPAHRHHDAASPFRSAIRDYYRFCDGLLGRALARCDDDDLVIVVSDHGARRLEGGVCVNEVLRREGLLVLKEEPPGPVRLSPDMVDWPSTTAWAEGGYYARVFLNLAGREPAGTVAPAEYASVRDRIAALFEGLADDRGRPMRTTAYRPEDLYPEREGLPPDLLVYFDDLAWRAVGSVGLGAVHTATNDTGVDHANHAQHGIFAMRDPQGRRGRREVVDILDIAPTILEHLGLPVPAGATGTALS